MSPSAVATPPVSRKLFVDNLRALTILLLFPFHIFMIYNDWGESWYIHGQALTVPSVINGLLSFWRMPLLFAIAGMSAHYALRRRSIGAFAKERVSKLLIPLIFGLLLVVPIQPYIAGLYFNGQANYFDSFTKLTDFSGYDGAFTPAHFWFILFLFVISMVSLPLMAWRESSNSARFLDKVPLVVVIALGLVPCFAAAVRIGGKSPTEDLAYFLLGYFFLTNDTLLSQLERYRSVLLGLVILSAVVSYNHGFQFYEAVSWLTILCVVGMAQRYLNFKGRVTSYLAQSSYGVYLFHQTWIVVAAFAVFKITDSPAIQMPLIFILAVGLTFLTYELCRRTRLTSWMFGLKRLQPASQQQIPQPPSRTEISTQMG